MKMRYCIVGSVAISNIVILLLLAERIAILTLYILYNNDMLVAFRKKKLKSIWFYNRKLFQKKLNIIFQVGIPLSGVKENVEYIDER